MLREKDEEIGRLRFKLSEFEKDQESMKREMIQIKDQMTDIDREWREEMNKKAEGDNERDRMLMEISGKLEIGPGVESGDQFEKELKLKTSTPNNDSSNKTGARKKGKKVEKDKDRSENSEDEVSKKNEKVTRKKAMKGKKES